ncbi:MAG: hypothetical protein R3E66_06440 [bacterium]
MKWMTVLMLMLVATSATAQESESTWTVGGNTDIGLMFKNRSPGVANMAGSLGLSILSDVDTSENVRLGFGAGIPSTIAPSLSLTANAKYYPFGWKSSGVYLQGQITPMYTYGTPCAWSETCDVPFPDRDAGRLYAVAGVVGKAGAGVQVNFAPVWVYLDTAMLGGLFKGIETDAGDQMSDGLYLGGEMTIGLRFPL